MNHPKGLFYLAFTEAWERFSFYGMSALLVLYMVNQLLLPGHVENIAGFTAFRATVESVFGPLSTQALASQIFGMYAGFVYFTPLLGGIIADRWIGQRSAVVIGALFMSAGHIAMAFDWSFLLALLLLVAGSGFIKGNISAQVGALYPRDDEARRTRGFAIFSMGINFGAVFGPMVCGLLAQVFGWHYGFGIAAIFMLAGLATYLYGYRHLPARVERRTGEKAELTPADWRVIGALVAVMAITIFQSIGYYQLGERAASMDTGARGPRGRGAHCSDTVVPVDRPALQHPRRAGAVLDLAAAGISETGSRVISARSASAPGCARRANLVLVAAIAGSRGAPVHPFWPFLACAVQGIAFLYYWPTLLALVSRAAPAKLNATMMGVAFMSLFVSNNLIGWVGGFYERMRPIDFWAMHAAIAATGGVLVMLFGRGLSRVLATAGANQPLRSSARTLEVER